MHVGKMLSVPLMAAHADAASSPEALSGSVVPVASDTATIALKSSIVHACAALRRGALAAVHVGPNRDERRRLAADALQPCAHPPGERYLFGAFGGFL